MMEADFCSLKEVTRWPSIMVYKDGESVEEFKGARSIERLQEFVAKHAEPSHAGSNEQGDTPMAIPLNLQDRRQEQNLQGVVTVLDESTFPTAMNQGPLFVKFYAPW
jgi:thioredoxin domain-containing protein 5